MEAAIAGLGQYVQAPITPTPSQVGQIGNAVCSAFDQGQSYSQIESSVVQQLQGIPFTTVGPGAGAYVVQTAVHLYCPGYAPRLG